MTLQWIPLESLEAHPENSNRMPPHLVAKLKAHLARTGRYEPLVVRPVANHADARTCPAASAAGSNGSASGRYQILNGHHRARVLRDLGHTHARCDVWDVDDEEARLLLATLNRLEGRDDPSRRAALVARLGEGRSAEDLARLLPEPPDAVERLRALAAPPPPPADPDAAAPLPRPMTFFLDEDQAATVREALRAATSASRGGSRHPPRRWRESRGGCPSASLGTGSDPPRTKRTGARRAEALTCLAEWYLEARGRR
ncbi:MAG: ParB/RepB/Spo0J family partition protein [Phycisphaerae bacterium]